MAAAVIVWAVKLGFKIAVRHSPNAVAVIGRVYRPAQMIAAMGAARAVLIYNGDFDWKDGAIHALLLGMVASMAWMAVSLLYLVRRTAERVYDGDTNVHDRRRRTQIVVLYRAVSAGIWLVAAGVAFMTFPGAQTIGASLLASAGIAGVIAGIAAQAMLKNIFAGLSLVFGDAIRLEDVIEVDGEWGHIEEIALSYVVVRIWDERRLLLPTSYFKDNPYRNWTRSTRAVMGVVELDVDWRLPMDATRTELDRIVTTSRYWDGRYCTLLVNGSEGNLKRLRPLVSAANADEQWFLRCEVREKLIDWIVREHPHCIPQFRIESTNPESGSRITAILPMQPGSSASTSPENRPAAYPPRPRSST